MRIYFIAALCLVLGCSNGFAQVSITQLPPATVPLNGGEVVPGVQNGQTVQIPESAIGLQGPSSATNGHVATFSGSSGKIIQDGGALGPYGEALQGQLPGTTTNDAASSGNIGQLISSTVASGSAVSLTTDTAKTVTSISLTAGDWDVWAYCAFTGNNATTVAYFAGSISTTDNTMATSPGVVGTQDWTGSTIFNIQAFGINFGCGRSRVSLSTTTTLYLVEQAGFGTNTASGYGFIGARRAR